jgi:hypothetical protein
MTINAKVGSTITNAQITEAPSSHTGQFTFSTAYEDKQAGAAPAI